MYEEEDVGKVFESFYQHLFTSNGETYFSTVEETISIGVTYEMNDTLCRIPHLEEVRKALFSINGGMHRELMASLQVFTSHSRVCWDQIFTEKFGRSLPQVI